MQLIHTTLAFIVALCILIVFHELGHYGVARLCNVKVLRFSVGFGKVLLSRRFGVDQTEWVISMIPLGGYVQMLDAREQDMSTVAALDLEREFTRQPVWKRMAIVAAGPLANFLLAIILFAALFMIGMPEPIAKLRQPDTATVAYQAGVRGNELVTAVNGAPTQLWSELRWELLQHALGKQPATLMLLDAASGQTRQITLPLNQLSVQDLETDFLNKLGLNLALSKAQLGQVYPDSAAMRAGLRQGDIIIQIDGKPVADSVDLIEIVQAAPGKLLHFTIDRAGALLTFPVTPDAIVVDGKSIGKLNVEVRSAPEMRTHHEAVWIAIPKAIQRTWEMSALTLKMIAKMVVGEVSLKNITGPLTIADYAGQTAKVGWISYLSFIALISISLGVMNLLPIPVLDGGHLLYYSLEFFTGRPVSARVIEIAQRAGIALLILLMALAFFNDLVRLLPAWF